MPKNSLHVFRELNKRISLFNKIESESLAFIVMEEIFGLEKTQVLTGQPLHIDQKTEKKLTSIIDRLEIDEPIQYIFGRTQFYGRYFKVNHHTLIPRPETEGLVELIITAINKRESLRILDLGTGSACIPISLALETSGHLIEAMDIDPKALALAHENAKSYGVSIRLFQGNIFELTLKDTYDIFISNPPYVRISERKYMRKNVRLYEPSQALFVPDKDPLKYYRAILELAKDQLVSNGQIFFEINENLAIELSELAQLYHFTRYKISKDLAGKNRYLQITVP